MVEELPRLTTAQASARLGVKPATLYAYVSRGLIERSRAESGGSTFDALDVEALAAAHRREAGSNGGRGRQPAAHADGRPLMMLNSGLTLLENDELYFRGRRATDLARELAFEQAINLLWDVRAQADESQLVGNTEVTERARKAGDLLGSSAQLIDRLAATVIVAGSFDPFRNDLSPDTVFSAGRRIIGAMVDALPDAGRPAFAATRLASRLWPKLTAQPASAEDLATLNAALVLCMDHDLATATLAARVAASARAHPYAAIGAALGAFDSALHGSASLLAAGMLGEAIDSTPQRAIAAQVSAGRGIPGFGHLIYRAVDPRAAYLLARMRSEPRYREAMSASDRVTALVLSRTARIPNVDLALATLVVGARMRPDAGQLIFAISRTAGWLAHIVDEYGQPPLRLRPESHYTGIRGGVDMTETTDVATAIT